MNPNQQDDLDRMLQGDDQASDSQAGTDDQGSDDNQNQTDPEAVEFNSLNGSTQDRIRKLARDKKELAEKLQSFQQNPFAAVPPAPNSGFRDPQEEAAIQTLADKGIATDEKVNKIVDSKYNEIRWELEQNKLESKYTGAQGEPQYVREEVEAFIQTHPQYRGYAAEDVFRHKMFSDEFLNVELQKRGTKTGRTQTLRPTKAAVAQEGMTPEYIEQRLQQPDGRQWYDEHLTEINAALSKMNPNQ